MTQYNDSHFLWDPTSLFSLAAEIHGSHPRSSTGLTTLSVRFIITVIIQVQPWIDRPVSWALAVKITIFHWEVPFIWPNNLPLCGFLLGCSLYFPLLKTYLWCSAILLMVWHFLCVLKMCHASLLGLVNLFQV